MISSKTPLNLPSDRRFGLLLVGVFAILGGYGSYKGSSVGAIYASFALSVVLALVTAIAPRILAPLNRAWFHIGQLLGKIVSPIVLGVIFYGLLTPIALLARMKGRDELKIKPRSVSSYWIQRNPPGPTADSFNNQF
jgi:hypothetical protein